MLLHASTGKLANVFRNIVLFRNDLEHLRRAQQHASPVGAQLAWSLPVDGELKRAAHKPVATRSNPEPQFVILGGAEVGTEDADFVEYPSANCRSGEDVVSALEEASEEFRGLPWSLRWMEGAHRCHAADPPRPFVEYPGVGIRDSGFGVPIESRGHRS